MDDYQLALHDQENFDILHRYEMALSDMESGVPWKWAFEAWGLI